MNVMSMTICKNKLECFKKPFQPSLMFVSKYRNLMWGRPIGLHHPLGGVTNPEYKLLCFIQLSKNFCKEKKALTFNRDRCCHLALCLQLILFH